MITVDNIRAAIEAHKSLFPPTDPVIKQLVLSLEIYEDRQEYNGTLHSAIECLLVAGYEIGDTLWDLK